MTVIIEISYKRSIYPFVDILLNPSTNQMTNFDPTDLRSSFWKSGTKP